jgi:Protein of Unknown function (DUF2784)
MLSMFYPLVADGVVILHLSFVLFVLFGGLLTFWWPRIAWLHLPAAAWGAAVEFGGWVCPLTPLEQWLRLKAGQSAYPSDFIEHYVLPVLYPAMLTHDQQIVLAALVVVVNVAVYGWVLRRTRHA